MIDPAKSEMLPQLRAVIYDFSAVSIIDSSGFQALLDIKRAVCIFSENFDGWFSRDMFFLID